MKETVDDFWRIEELTNAVALALAANYEGAVDGRTRGVPDLRTIRYYTTLGLIDRPVKWWNRTALYNRRHLLQIVAIKRLQHRGYSLAELQQRLVGLSDRALEELARVPADLKPSVERVNEFWKAPPAPASQPGQPDEGCGSTSTSNLENSAPQPAAQECREAPAISLQGVRLADDVTLLLSPARALEPDDLEAIRVVAAPLLKLLQKRRLLRARGKGPTP